MSSFKPLGDEDLLEILSSRFICIQRPPFLPHGWDAILVNILLLLCALVVSFRLYTKIKK